MLSNQDLFKALSKNQREIVDLNIGAIPLQPTVTRGGQYQVPVRNTLKDNSATRLAKALNQFPQVVGQYKNLQTAAGIEEVQKKSPEELEQMLNERVEKGDEEAKMFSFDYFKQKSIDEELYRQAHIQQTQPSLYALEKEIERYSLQDIQQLFRDPDTNEMLTGEEVERKLIAKYESAIPENVRAMAEKNGHQTALHNNILRQIPNLAAKSMAVITSRRDTYLKDERNREIATGGLNIADIVSQTRVPKLSSNVEISDQSQIDYNFYRELHGEDAENVIRSLPGNEELKDSINNPEAAGLDLAYRGAGDTMLPALEDEDGNAEDEIQLNAPEELPALELNVPSVKENKKASSAGPDGNFSMNSLDAFRRGEVDYVTAAGSGEFIGKSYIMNKVSYVDAKGDRYTLANVPVSVHDSNESLVNAPEGKFDLIADYNLSKEQVTLNNEAVKGAKFVRDEKKDFTLPLKYQKKASDVVQQSNASFKMQVGSLAQQMSDGFNDRYAKGVSRLSRDEVESDVITHVNQRVSDDMAWLLNNDYFELADKFIEGAESGQLTLNGERYDPSLIMRLKRLKETAEDRFEKEQEETEGKVGEDLGKDLMSDINMLVANAANYTESDLREEYSKFTRIAAKLAADRRISGDVHDDIRAELSSAKAEIDDVVNATDNVYTDPVLRGKIERDYRASGWQRNVMDMRKFISTVETAGFNMDMFKVPPTLLSDTQKEVFNNILTGVSGEAAERAIIRATSDMVGILKSNGKREAEVFTIDPTDQNGLQEPTSSIMLYRGLLDKYFEEEAISLYQQKKDILERDAESIASQKVTKGVESLPIVPGVPSTDQTTVKRQQLRERVSQKDTILIKGTGENAGSIDNERLMEEDLDTIVNIVNNTLSDSDNLILFKDQNTLEQRQRLLTDVGTYMAANDNEYFKEKAIELDRLRKSSAYTQLGTTFTNLRNSVARVGLPMNIHHNNGVVSYNVKLPKDYYGQFDFWQNSTTPDVMTYTLDFNMGMGDDDGKFYSKKQTAQTFVYNARAIIDYTKGNENAMRFLWTNYFEKGGSVSFDSFVNYQLALGRQYNFIDNNTTSAK